MQTISVNTIDKIGHHEPTIESALKVLRKFDIRPFGWFIKANGNSRVWLDQEDSDGHHVDVLVQGSFTGTLTWSHFTRIKDEIYNKGFEPTGHNYRTIEFKDLDGHYAQVTFYNSGLKGDRKVRVSWLIGFPE